MEEGIKDGKKTVIYLSEPKYQSFSQEIKALWDNGKVSMSTIAKKLGISKNTVSKSLCFLRLHPNPSPKIIWKDKPENYELTKDTYNSVVNEGIDNSEIIIKTNNSFIDIKSKDDKILLIVNEEEKEISSDEFNSLLSVASLLGFSVYKKCKDNELPKI